MLGILYVGTYVQTPIEFNVISDTMPADSIDYRTEHLSSGRTKHME